MNDTSANPIFVALLFILRCVVPLAILFGISYLLRKMGLVAVETSEPSNNRDETGKDPGETAFPKEAEVIRPESIGASIKGNKTVKKTRSRSK